MLSTNVDFLKNLTLVKFMHKPDVFPYHSRQLPQVLFLPRQKTKQKQKNVFCHDKYLSRQTYFCRDKRRVLSGQTRVCRDTSTLVASKLLLEQCLLRQTFCRDKHCLSRLKTCFVATNTCLLRQIRLCRDKTFVATK